MTTKVEQIGSVTFVRPEGRIDSTTSPELDNAMRPPGPDARRVLLDLSSVAYMSSAGLRIVLVAMKTAQSSGGQFVVFGLNAGIRAVFEISGFGRIVPIAATEAEALAMVGA